MYYEVQQNLVFVCVFYYNMQYYYTVNPIITLRYS